MVAGGTPDVQSGSSIRVSDPVWLVTQTAPKPTAIERGLARDVNGGHDLVRARVDLQHLTLERAHPDEPVAEGDRPRPTVEVDAGLDVTAVSVDAHDGAVVPSGHPYRSGADGDAAGRRTHLHGVLDLAVPGTDGEDAAVESGYPHQAVVAVGHRERALAGRPAPAEHL